MLLAAMSSSAAGVHPDPIVDRSTEHVVARGDSLVSIGARYGVSVQLIARQNGLDPRKPLRPGQVLQVTARHVVPQPLDEGILINLPQRMLFLFRGGRLASAYPVAVGRASWPTPTGHFKVLTRETDKTWIVPVSIQEEMRREGKPVLTRVPPGPENPLGRHWIGLSLPAIGIHGTIAPASVYGFRSHGCIRVHPDDVAQLFDRVAIGEPGRIVYLPLLIAQGDDGRIWFVRLLPDETGNPKRADLWAMDLDGSQPSRLGTVCERPSDAGVAPHMVGRTRWVDDGQRALVEVWDEAGPALFDRDGQRLDTLPAGQSLTNVPLGPSRPVGPAAWLGRVAAQLAERGEAGGWPTLSPDGEQLLVAASALGDDGRAARIVGFQVSAGVVYDVLDDAAQPAWSPTFGGLGKLVAVSSAAPAAPAIGIAAE